MVDQAGSAPKIREPQTLALWHGPNLNLLGTREPQIYGHHTLADVEQLCAQAAAHAGWRLDARQTNHEGELLEWIQESGAEHAAGTLIGAILNAGGWTHTSVALADAISGAGLPVVEVHISNTFAREDFRHHSYLSPVARGIIVGFGVQGYRLAVQSFAS